MNQLGDVLSSPAEGYPSLPIDSLERALQVAMHTISLASNAVSGKATELLPLPDNPSDLAVPECPVRLPPMLADKNYCEYRGYYHTDFTLPSEYFLNAVERPTEIKSYSLDFTYLFRRTLDNPDFISMGKGRPIRAFPEEEELALISEEDLGNPKQLQSNESTVMIEREERLVAALQQRGH